MVTYINASAHGKATMNHYLNKAYTFRFLASVYEEDCENDAKPTVVEFPIMAETQQDAEKAVGEVLQHLVQGKYDAIKREEEAARLRYENWEFDRRMREEREEHLLRELELKKQKQPYKTWEGIKSWWGAMTFTDLRKQK